MDELEKKALELKAFTKIIIMGTSMNKRTSIATMALTIPYQLILFLISYSF